MDPRESQISAFESLLRQVARTPGYEPEDRDIASVVAPGLLVGGRFEIVGELGSGGFARVYEAEDRVLSRRVALKLLRRNKPLNDREMELFYREARATARLNHPSIVIAHDWGQWQGVPFLVLERLEGEPLARLVERGPVGEQRALAIARELAATLAYAHERGVLHLDLKAQNVFVGPGDSIKVLDFGLAGIESDEPGPRLEPRIAGGTPATMAPEQRRGDRTDARADLWAVGVLLHQLLFGKLPHRDAGDLCFAGTASRRAATILSRTLIDDRERRFPSAAALGSTIDRALRLRQARRRLFVGVALTAALLSVLTLSRSGKDQPAAPAAAPAQRQLTFRGDVIESDVSPGGDRLAYLTAGQRELWLRSVDGRDAHRLLRKEMLSTPRWTADGEAILVTNQLDPPQMWLVPAAGGEATYLGETDNVLHVELPGGGVASPGPRLQHVDVERPGGDRVTLELPATTTMVQDIDTDDAGRLLVTTFDGRGHLLELAPGAPARELRSESQRISAGRWRGDGEGVFYALDPGIAGELRYLPTRPGTRPLSLVSGAVGEGLSVSRDGRRLVFHRQTVLRNLERMSPGGRLEAVTAGTAQIGSAALARDGGALAFAVREGEQGAIVFGEPGSIARRRIPCPGRCGSPAWSPDGRRLAYRREEGGAWRIAVRSLDGGGEVVVAAARPSTLPIASLLWLSEREILYMPRNDAPLRVIDIESGKDRPFLDPPAASGGMYFPVLSGDGARVAFYWARHRELGVYRADRSGRRLDRIAEGRLQPIAWSDGGRRLVVGVMRYSSEPFIQRIESLALDGGPPRPLWAAPPGYHALSAFGAPEAGDVVLLRSETRSDAWLLENPLALAGD